MELQAGDHDPCKQDPLTVTKEGSLMCSAPSYKMEEFRSQSHGKWLIFRNFEDLNKTWCVVREAVLSGALGATGAICGTRKYTPLHHGAGPKTKQLISVFTKEEDYIEVGLKLVLLEAVQHDIQYKTKEASHRGRFVHKPGVHGRVTCMDIYWNNGEPYASTRPRPETVLCPPPRCNPENNSVTWKINVVEGQDKKPYHGKWIIISDYKKKSLSNIEILWDELKAKIETGELPVIQMECPAPRYCDKGRPEIHISTSRTNMDSVGSKLQQIGEGKFKLIGQWPKEIKQQYDKNGVPNGITSYNLLAIILAFSLLLALTWLAKGLYRHLHMNLLEVSLYLNLICLSAVTATLPEPSKEIVTDILVGIYAFTAVVVIAYQIHLSHFAQRQVQVALLSSRCRVSR